MDENYFEELTQEMATITVEAMYDKNIQSNYEKLIARIAELNNFLDNEDDVSTNNYLMALGFIRSLYRFKDMYAIKPNQEE